MSRTEELLSARAGEIPVPTAALAACIDALQHCAVACRSCAAACLAEPSVDELRECVRMDLDCATICDATVAVLAGWSGERSADDHLLGLVAACGTACSHCAEECGHHEAMAHCVLCAGACADAAQECLVLTAALHP